MKFFFDTEFIEAPCSIDLISIGIVCESGETLYMESSEVDWSRASQWVLDNVRPHLSGHSATRAQIADAVRQFVADNDDGSQIEFWGYYADYDWVVFCWLFGSMVDLPKGFPYYCRDVKQWADMLGVTREQLPPDPTQEHHALADAHWTHDAWRYLDSRAVKTRSRLA